jgi:hypothetical protein
MKKLSVKTNRRSNNSFDHYQTPSYALNPLVPYLFGTVWECASGEGLLSSAIKEYGFNVIESDILYGQDFFEW